MAFKLDIDVVFEAETEQPVWSVDIHPDKPLIAISNGFEKIEVWNFETKSKLATISATSRGLSDHKIKFISRDKDWLVVGSDDGHVKVYNLTSFNLVKDVQVSSESISSMTIHPDGPFLLTTSLYSDPVIKVWNWKQDWKCKLQFSGHSTTIKEIKLNPIDSDMFATGSEDKTIRIWSLSHDQSLAILSDGDNWIQCLDFSPSIDEPHLISGCLDGTVRIWNYRTFQLVKRLDRMNGLIQSIRFHQLLPIFIVQTYSKIDHHVRIYDAITYRKLAQVCEHCRSMEVRKNFNILVIGGENGVKIFEITKNIDKQLLNEKDSEIRVLKEENMKLRMEITELRKSFVNDQLL